jgi:hypothetical protein
LPFSVSHSFPAKLKCQLWQCERWKMWKRLRAQCWAIHMWGYDLFIVEKLSMLFICFAIELSWFWLLIEQSAFSGQKKFFGPPKNKQCGSEKNYLFCR